VIFYRPNNTRRHVYPQQNAADGAVYGVNYKGLMFITVILL